MRKGLWIGAILAAMAAGGARADNGDDGALTYDDLMAIVAGKTLHYEQFGEPYGREHFDEDGKTVTWQYVDGECDTALWEATGAGGTLMCFYYEPSSCWRVFGDDTAMAAHLVDPAASDPYIVDVVRIDDAPLECAINAISQAPSRRPVQTTSLR